MRDVGDETFEADVVRTDGAVAVNFWAPWCGPCETVDRVLAELERERGLVVLRLNVDEHPLTASRYDVLSLPTVILFEGGEPRETVLGARSRSHFERRFEPWLPDPARERGSSAP